MNLDYSALVYVMIAVILVLKTFAGNCSGGSCS
jgi:hypothetical protein